MIIGKNNLVVVENSFVEYVIEKVTPTENGDLDLNLISAHDGLHYSAVCPKQEKKIKDGTVVTVINKKGVLKLFIDDARSKLSTKETKANGCSPRLKENF